MIVSNRVGTDDGVTCCGSSAIIDPYGVTIASASTDREELVPLKCRKRRSIPSETKWRSSTSAGRILRKGLIERPR
jgi:predicted amidohydrolase